MKKMVITQLAKKINHSLTLFFLIFGGLTSRVYSETITVGCTIGCSNQIQTGILRAAKSLNLSVEFTNLIKSPSTGFDVLISPGGGDPDPSFYTKNLNRTQKNKIFALNKKYSKQTDKSRARDAFEYKLLSSYFEDQKYKNTRALGICYGMQMMGIVKGMPLYVDIEQELGVKPRIGYLNDVVYIKQGTLAYKIFKSASILGRKYHHQALNLKFFQDNPNLFLDVTFSAFSNGGKIPEIIEFKNRNAIGVQFHPEHKNSDPNVTNRLFAWLLSDIKPE